MHRYYFLAGITAASLSFNQHAFSLINCLSFLALAAVLFVFSYQLGAKK